MVWVGNHSQLLPFIALFANFCHLQSKKSPAQFCDRIVRSAPVQRTQLCKISVCTNKHCIGHFQLPKATLTTFFSNLKNNLSGKGCLELTEIRQLAILPAESRSHSPGGLFILMLQQEKRLLCIACTISTYIRMMCYRACIQIKNCGHRTVKSTIVSWGGQR